MKRPLFNSLRARLMVLVFVIIVPLLGLLIYHAIEERNEKRLQALGEATRLAWNASTLYSKTIVEARQILFTLSQMPQVQQQDPDACSKIFADLLKQTESYTGFTATKLNGEVFASVPGSTKSVNLADRPWFQRVLQTRDFVISEYLIGRLSSKPTIILAYPVLDSTGRLMAILSTGLDMERLQQTLVNIELPDGTNLTIIDSEGTIILRFPDPEQFVGKRLLEKSIIKNILTKSAAIEEGVGLDGKPRLFGYATVGSGSEVIYIKVSIPKQIAFADVKRRLVNDLTWLGLVAVLAFLGAWLFGSIFILSPVHRLIDMTKIMADGDLTVRTGRSYVMGELGLLAYSFDQMADSLQHREEALHRSEEKYRIHFENASDAVYSIDREFNILGISPSVERILGYKPEELIGRSFQELNILAPEYLEEAFANSKRLFAGEYIDTSVYEFIAKDGARKFGEISSTPVLQEGEVVAAVFIARDITRRILSEEALSKSNRALKVLSRSNKAVVRASSETDLMNDMCRIIVKDGGYRLAWVGFAGEDEQKIVHPVAQAGYEDGYLKTIHVTWSDEKSGRGPTGTAIRTGESVICNNILSDPNFAPWRDDAIARNYASSVALPLIANGKTFGSLNIYAEEPDAFDKEETRLLMEMAEDLAFGIMALRTRAERNRTENRLTMLYELGISMGKSSDEIADHIVTIITSTTRMKMASVEKIENDTISIASFFKDGRISHKGTLSLKDSPCAEVVKDKKPCEQHRAAEKFPQNVFLRENNVYFYSCVPVISSKGDVIGIICGMDSVEIDFSEDDRELLYTLGRRMASEWEQESYLSQIRNANRRLETLLKLASSLSQSLELEEILNQALNAMFESDFLKLEEEALVFILDKEKQELVLTAHQGLSEDVIQYEARVNVGECLCGKAALTGEVLFSPNSEKNPQHTRCMPHMPHIGIHADIVIPLKSREEILGILMCHRKADTAFSTEERDIFGSIGSQLGMAIDNAILFKKTRNYTVELEERVKQRTQEINTINEELVRASQAKSDFLASMSHELRTPLTAVIGFSEVLKDQYFGELNEKQAGYVKDIFESGKHLLSLINDILDLSKVEAGKMELELSEINIKHLLENSMIMIKEKAMKHGIRLDLQIPDELSDLEIQADERKIKQVMFNLLSNAAKFTPDGGAIKLEAEQKGEELTISVSDTGIGIAPEDQKKIFEEFYQVSGGKKDKTPGTGLGLPLSMRLLEIHGGRLWVESEGKNKGSRFSFTLPLRAEPPKPSMPEIYGGKTFSDHLKKIISLSQRENRIFTICCFYPEGENMQEKISRVKEVLNKEKRTKDLSEMDESHNLYLVLQDTNYEGAKGVCDRIIQKVESMIEGLEVSCSIATFPEDGKTPEELIGKVTLLNP